MWRRESPFPLTPFVLGEFIANNIWFSSDHHFGHANILTFKDKNDELTRKFSSLEHMHWTMIDNHNKVVKPQDKVYFLGDVVINKKALPMLAMMNGHKRLIRGNHDIFETKHYLPYFEEIYGVRVFEQGIVATHIPIHKDSMSRWKLNVHGHLHTNKVMLSPHHPDPQYRNVSMEQINYTPISMEEILDAIP